MDWNTLGGAFHPEDLVDGVAERLPVPEAGFADERAVYIEENQIRGQVSV